MIIKHTNINKKKTPSVQTFLPIKKTLTKQNLTLDWIF